LVEKGKSYRFANVVTSLWNGQKQIKINKSSEIIPLDKPIKVIDLIVTITAPVLEVRDSGNGLVRKCVVTGCTRILDKGVCKDHGKQDTSKATFELHGNVLFDDGKKARYLILNTAICEKILGTTLKDAIKETKETMDGDLIRSQLRDKLLGRYWKVTGTEIGSNLLATSVEAVV